MRNLDFIKEKKGNQRRLQIQDNGLKNNPIVPNPVEYEDIDNTFCEYFKENVVIIDEDGKKFDTFTFFSSQRFSEFLQTWGHDDEDGNLLMNFFTITRENNPNWGTLSGGAYNIPGRNRFTIQMRDIVDDNGEECYEVTSMSQPVLVDINYHLNLVTAKFKYLNEFNVKINQLFASRQCYLCVNGHYMPMVLDSVNDSSDYTIDGRKFYMQSVDIKLMAYLIPKDDIKVKLFPKRKMAKTRIEGYGKTYVSMDYDENDEAKFKLMVKFKPKVTQVNFTVDEEMYISLSYKDNANNPKLKINGDVTEIHNRIKLDEGDEVFIKIAQPNPTASSMIVFDGELVLD